MSRTARIRSGRFRFVGRAACLSCIRDSLPPSTALRSSCESRLSQRCPFVVMKVGDPVFVVSCTAGLEPGTRARIAALDGSIAWVSVSSPAEPQLLPVQIWDLLPARVYGCAVLHGVCATVRSLKAGGGSTLLLTPEQLVRKLIEHGLNPSSARQCVELWNTDEQALAPLSVREWLLRIKRYYNPRAIPPPGVPNDHTQAACPAAFQGVHQTPQSLTR